MPIYDLSGYGSRWPKKLSRCQKRKLRKWQAQLAAATNASTRTATST